jgi:hypothetical protein
MTPADTHTTSHLETRRKAQSQSQLSSTLTFTRRDSVRRSAGHFMTTHFWTGTPQVRSCDQVPALTSLAVENRAKSSGMVLRP